MRAILVSVAVVSLVGCAATPSDYAQTDEMKLCMDYMTFPSYNIHQPAREIAIRQRGIDCSRYSGAANARIRANQNFENLLRGLANQPGYPASGRVPSPGVACVFTRDVVSGVNRLCYYNCAGSGHAVTVGAAQVCPIQTFR
jgi:hypothetical protein